MIKFLGLVLFSLLVTSFNYAIEEGASTSPSPQGDIRMGADAVTTGTDVTDKEIQAQEDKGRMSQDQQPPQRKELQEEKAEPVL